MTTEQSGRPQGVAELLSLLKEIRETNGGNPPPVDPTANVLSLVAAAMQRQDDLRAAETKRRDDLFAAEQRHRAEIREQMNTQLDARLNAEKERVNALLAAAQSAVALDRTRAELTASALAERVDTSAKTLSAQVETTAKAAESAVVAAATSLNSRIAPLEQFRFEQGGAKTQQVEGKSDNRWVIGIAISAPSFLLAVVALVYALTK
jgi:poly-gamma-glutamate capsule biosynthesis protein CapA/YwtB (metallophosphatase superfamily)